MNCTCMVFYISAHNISINQQTRYQYQNSHATVKTSIALLKEQTLILVQGIMGETNGIIPVHILTLALGQLLMLLTLWPPPPVERVTVCVSVPPGRPLIQSSCCLRARGSSLTLCQTLLLEPLLCMPNRQHVLTFS